MVSLSPSSRGYGQDSHDHTMAQIFRPGKSLKWACSLQYPGLLPEILLFPFTLLMYCPIAYLGFPSVCQETTGCDAPACLRAASSRAPACGNLGSAVSPRIPRVPPPSGPGESDLFLFNTIRGCENNGQGGMSMMSSISVNHTEAT